MHNRCHNVFHITDHLKSGHHSKKIRSICNAFYYIGFCSIYSCHTKLKHTCVSHSNDAIDPVLCSVVFVINLKEINRSLINFGMNKDVDYLFQTMHNAVVLFVALVTSCTNTCMDLAQFLLHHLLQCSCFHFVVFPLHVFVFENTFQVCNSVFVQ